ncbi:MAG: hypothetical protein PHX83_16025 [Acidobacteriia bacterium]|nr:hypothetical protein [Terriglobia bacterium]
MKNRTYLFIAVMALLIIGLSIPANAQTMPNFRLRYAQAANGVIGSQTYITTLFVTNPQNFSIQAFIDSFDDANPANPIGLGFSTSCGFDPTTNLFTVPADGTCQFVSDGQGPLKTGWLRATENSGNNNIGGYLVFTLYQGNQFSGFPLLTVGVSPTAILSQFSVPVVRDVNTGKDVGFAMANPFNDGPVTMAVQLVDPNGNPLEEHDVTLQTEGHLAEFASQFFSTLANARNFVGSIVATQRVAQDGVVATALLQTGAQLGGAPPTEEGILAAKSAHGSLRPDASSPQSREVLKSGTAGPGF